MRRAIFVLIPCMIGMGLSVAIFIAATAFPLGARETVLQYIQTMDTDAQMGAYERACCPWRLTKNLELITYGENWFSRTNRKFEVTPEIAITQLAGREIAYWSDNSSTNTGARLHFPPEEIWCVQLVGTQRDETLLVARHHQEPYGTDWVIHKTYNRSDDMDKYAHLVGCTIP